MSLKLDYKDFKPFLDIAVSYGLLMPYIKLTFQDDSYMEEYADIVISQLMSCKSIAITNNDKYTKIPFYLTYIWCSKDGILNLLNNSIEKEKEKNRIYYIDKEFIKILDNKFFSEKYNNKFTKIFYDFLSTENKDLIYSLPTLFDEKSNVSHLFLYEK